MADWRALIARTLAQEPAGRFPEVLPVSTRQNLPAEDGGNVGLSSGPEVLPVLPVFGSVGQSKGSNPTYLPIVVTGTPLTPPYGAQKHSHAQTHRQKPAKPAKPPEAENPDEADPTPPPDALLGCPEDLAWTPSAPQHPPEPVAWQEVAARLQRMAVPAGIVPDQFEMVRFAGEVLTVGWARQAVSLGWSEIDLYGCQLGPFPLAVPGGVVVEAVRHDAEVCALTTDTATLRFRDGTGHRYVYRDTLPEGMVPLWELPSR